MSSLRLIILPSIYHPIQKQSIFNLKVKVSTTVVTGTSDASRASIVSTANSYKGVRYCHALLGSGYTLIAGGKTISNLGVETVIDLLTITRVSSTTTLTDGSVRYNYEWRRFNPPVVSAHAEDAQAVSLTDAGHDGQVLLCGGHTALASTSNVSTIVNHRPASPGPESITAVASGNMTAARGMHRATKLNNNKVFVTGGFTTWSTPLNSTEAWNPTTATWTAKSAMDTARMDHGQILLDDGRVLVAGGLVGATTYTSLCEVYDPDTNTWAATGRMAWARAGHSLIKLPTGHILAIGGTGYETSKPTSAVALASTEVWDPNSGLWRPMGSLATARARPAAILVSSLNSILVTGGQDTSIELLDLTSGNWHLSVASLSVIRRDTQAIVFGNGVIFPGGTEEVSSIWTTTEKSSILVPGIENVASGGINGVFKVSDIVDGFTFKYESGVNATTSLGTGGTVMPVKAEDIEWKGPHIIDPIGPAVTEIESVTLTRLEAGRPIVSIVLSDVSDPDPALKFPDTESWLVLRLGQNGQTPPIRCLGRLSSTELRLDGSFTPEVNIEPGDTVTLLSSRTPWVIEDPTVGLLWVTASPSGRVAASSLLDDVVAAGITLTKRIEYPSDVGLGAEGSPTSNAEKLSEIVDIYAGDDVDKEVKIARNQ